jgi:hypothetical protein
MNNPNTSYSEQKAEQLWQDYPMRNTVLFWKDYEALLEQQKRQEKVMLEELKYDKPEDNEPAKNTATVAATAFLTPNTQVYRPSLKLLIPSNVIVANLVAAGVFLALDDSDVNFGWLLVVFVVASWLNIAWDYTSFKLSGQGLTINKIGIDLYNIGWGMIESVEFNQVEEKNYLKVMTYGGEAHNFKLLMEPHVHQELQVAIRHYLNNPMP